MESHLGQYFRYLGILRKLGRINLDICFKVLAYFQGINDMPRS